MEQKKIQRIIGIVVVIALVVVVMPLILGKNDIPILGNTINSNKTSLPEQSATVASDMVVHPASPSETNTTSATAEPANSSINPTTDVASTNSMDTTPANPQDNTATTPALPTPPALSSTAQTTPADASPKPTDAMDTTDKPAPTPGTIVYEPVTPTPAAPIVSGTPPAATPEPVAQTPTETIEKTSTTTPSMPKSKSDPSTMKIKQAVMKEKKLSPKSVIAVHAKTKPTLQKMKTGWVVQMGNFAVKKNAVRLAKQLRAAGYKVFTQDVKTATGKINTRVYIGPELKQASATKLSNDIHHRMNMQGYVMSYKL